MKLWQRAYLATVQRLHDKGWLWPVCWDCRLLRQARREEEFYVHDEPLWYVRHVVGAPHDLG